MTIELVRLLTWFSPGFPTGAFGFSHGLETALREGLVSDASGLQAWIEGLLIYGGGWTDAVLFKAAWDASPEALPDLAEIGFALAPSFERRRETLVQGEAFLQAVRAWGDVPLGDGPAPYPIAAGAACQALGVSLEASLHAWLHGFAANLVSVAVRSMPLGQRAGVALLAALEPAVTATARHASTSTLDDVGGCALISDICAMRHETLDGRLFVS
jgi:urease accessory protein